jgi:hypothetical protein
MQRELQRLDEENIQLKALLRDQESKYFKEKEEWIEERTKLIEELASGNGGKLPEGEMENSILEEITRLRN